MNRRGRRLIAAIAGVVVLLFAGRWAAGLLTDRWWAAQISPAAVGFVTDWHVLRLTLDLAGFLLAAAWFIGHLLVVYRAVGSVQVRRHVANLEFREALTPGMLLGVAVAAGALLGLLVGTGGAERWQQVALAWQGVTYGVADPLLQKDAGLYVAQLPVWRLAHGFALLLVVLSLGIVFALYALMGAVRWLEGRPAINDHARTHLGWLLTGLALCLVWGYVLEPYELLAGLGGPLDLAAWRATQLVSPLLVGVALATAGLSAAWALRPRHALAAAGWIVLSFASLIGHWMVPPAMEGDGEPAASPRVIAQLDGLAYGVAGLADERYTPDGPPAPPRVPALWNIEMIGHMAAADSQKVVAIDPAVVMVRGRPRASWLAVRVAPNGRTSVAAVADDRAGNAGQALFYAASDTMPGLDRDGLLDLGVDAFRPDAPPYRFETGDRRGIEVGGVGRRVMLAWALQAGRLLSDLPPGSKVDWRLSPSERLAALAPFARLGRAGPQDREPRAGLGRPRVRRASRVSTQHPATVARARNRRAPRRLPRHGRGRHGRDPDLSQARGQCVGRRLGRDRAGRRGARLGDPGGGPPGGAVPGRVVPGAGPVSRGAAAPARQPRRAARLPPLGAPGHGRCLERGLDGTGPDGDLRARRRAARRRRPHRHRRQRHGRASTGPLRLRPRRWRAAARWRIAGATSRPTTLWAIRSRKTEADWSADRCGSRSARAGRWPISRTSRGTREATSRSPG